MTKNNPGRRFPLSSTFFLKHLLMPWTVVAIAMGDGADGGGLPLPCLARRSACLTTPPHPASSPFLRGGGSHGDCDGWDIRSSSTARCAAPWKAVPRVAINREYPDGIATTL
jgi:hypothetical protein